MFLVASGGEVSQTLSLVLICRRCICDVTAGTSWDSSRTNENIRCRQLEPSQSSTADMPAKLKLSELRRHGGGKDLGEQCCRPLLFSYRNSIPGSTGGHVACTSAAYENPALPAAMSRVLRWHMRTRLNSSLPTDTMKVFYFASCKWWLYKEWVKRMKAEVKQIKKLICMWILHSS